MSDAVRPTRATQLPPVVRDLGLGFAYWLLFLLVLEPDNLMRMSHVVWGEEAARILGATLLGTVATPPLLALVRRYPVTGADWHRNVALEAAAAAGVAGILIVVSCILADWFLVSEHRPLLLAVRENLVANWTLMLFCIAALLALAHAMVKKPGGARVKVADPEPAANYPTRVASRSRGCTRIVDLCDVDWVEAQGNYVALHVGPTVHLIRESMADFETRIDPVSFVRIHRRTIVSVDRIESLKSLGAGDAILRLKDGTDLRLSRSFRDRLAVACPHLLN